jgi:hypothetical protein
MAEEKTPKPATETAAASQAAAPPAPAKHAPSLATRIVKQVKRTSPGGSVSPAHPAGTYEVVHGRVNLGYEHPRDKDGAPLTHVKPEAIYAHPGDHVNLAAEEASALLADGTLRLVAVAA